MDLANIITEIETIRFHNYQVCEKVGFLEAQIDRLKHPDQDTVTDIDGANWFHIEAQNEQLGEQAERLQSRSKKIRSQFDFELQKLRDEYDRRQQYVRQQAGGVALERKLQEARDRLASTRAQLDALRKEQNDLSKAIERGQRQHDANQTVARRLRELLDVALAHRQVRNRLRIHENQRHALERRLANVRAGKTQATAAAVERPPRSHSLTDGPARSARSSSAKATDSSSNSATSNGDERSACVWRRSAAGPMVESRSSASGCDLQSGGPAANLPSWNAELLLTNQTDRPQAVVGRASANRPPLQSDSDDDGVIYFD